MHLSPHHRVQDRPAGAKAPRRGLTLLETLIAVAVLLVVVTAVMSALQAGRAMALDARQHVTASLAAEMLMARVTSVDQEQFSGDDAWYAHFIQDASDGGWNGHQEAPGSIRAGTKPDQPLLPADYQAIALGVSTSRAVHRIPAPLQAEIDGVEVHVRAMTPEGRDVVDLVRFVPVPRELIGGAP